MYLYCIRHGKLETLQPSSQSHFIFIRSPLYTWATHIVGPWQCKFSDSSMLSEKKQHKHPHEPWHSLTLTFSSWLWWENGDYFLDPSKLSCPALEQVMFEISHQRVWNSLLISSVENALQFLEDPSDICAQIAGESKVFLIVSKVFFCPWSASVININC